MAPSGNGNLIFQLFSVLLLHNPSCATFCRFLSALSFPGLFVVVLTGSASCCSCSCWGKLAPFRGAYHLWGLGKRIKAVCQGVTPLFFPSCVSGGPLVDAVELN